MIDRLAGALLVGLALVGPGIANAREPFAGRRVIVAFVAAGTPARIELEDRLAERRRALAVRNVDVHFVDPDEIDSLLDDGLLVEPRIERLRSLRDPDSDDMQLVLVGKDGEVKAWAGSVQGVGDFLLRVQALSVQ